MGNTPYAADRSTLLISRTASEELTYALFLISVLAGLSFRVMMVKATAHRRSGDC